MLLVEIGQRTGSPFSLFRDNPNLINFATEATEIAEEYKKNNP